MRKSVTMRELTDALSRLGFAEPETRGQYIVFRHDATETIVILPRLGPRQSVGRARLGAIRLTVIGRDVATAEQFDDALSAVHV